MSEQTFEDRVAQLEEHIVSRRVSAEEWLERAEDALSRGEESRARHALTFARIVHDLDEMEEDDDA
jgi:phage shock protein A